MLVWVAVLGPLFEHHAGMALRVARVDEDRCDDETVQDEGQRRAGRDDREAVGGAGLGVQHHASGE